MPADWSVAASNWGRRSRGATVKLGGLGEVNTVYSLGRFCSLFKVVRGVECGTQLCIESAVSPGNYLTTVYDSRVVWRKGGGLGHNNFVRIIMRSSPGSKILLFSSPSSARVHTTPWIQTHLVRLWLRGVRRGRMYCSGGTD